jgi:capsular exopolysaccharide synthesis family protein
MEAPVEVELRQLFATLRRRLWLLLVIPAVAGVISYGLTSRQTPMYRATSVVMVNPTTTTGTADYYAILSSQSLVETYRQLVKFRPVMEAVIGEFSLPMSVSDLQGRITTTSIEGTQLVRITASDPSAQRAAAIANAVASEFAKFVASQTGQVSASFRAVLDQQIQETKQQIDDTAKQVQQLQSKPAPTSDDQAQLAILNTQLGQLQDAYGQLLNTSQTMALDAAAAQAQVTISESAMPPTAPFAPRVAFRTGIGLFAGLLIAGATVFALEYLDDTVKASTNFGSTFGVPLLGSIEKMAKFKEPRKQLFVLDRSRRRGHEAIRVLRTNLEFATAPKGIRSVAFSGATPGEGVSTIIANLAVAIAQVEIPVVVIDADMRQPTQHMIFRTRNDAGLSTFLGKPTRAWDSIAIESGIPNLRIIPSGPQPPDPADLLDRRLGQLVEELTRAGYFTLVDAPSILAGSDALIVSAQVDGVVVVCRDHRTRIDTLRRAISLLAPAGTKIVGIVLNRLETRRGDNHYAGQGRRLGKRGVAMMPMPTSSPQPLSRSSATLSPSDGQ